jgi:hypothetical protein
MLRYRNLEISCFLHLAPVGDVVVIVVTSAEHSAERVAESACRKQFICDCRYRFVLI